MRGRGYIKIPRDIEHRSSGPTVTEGTLLHPRRGRGRISDPTCGAAWPSLTARGSTVGGIVVMRYGENALTVIDAVKAKLKEIEPSLARGREDRADSTTAPPSSMRAIETLRRHAHRGAGDRESPGHLRVPLARARALIPILTLPIAVILSFIPMPHSAGSPRTSCRSAASRSRSARWSMPRLSWSRTCTRSSRTWDEMGAIPTARRAEIIMRAAGSRGRSLFFSLLVITVWFCRSSRWKPRGSALQAARLHQDLLDGLCRAAGRDAHARARGLANPRQDHARDQEPDQPRPDLGLRAGRALRGSVPLVHDRCGVLMLVAPYPGFSRLGNEFMPPLNEGTILYMPTAPPGMSITEATRLLQIQDRKLKEFPEVERVFGKTGRAETPTDPAPLAMVETVVTLKPMSQWRPA